MKLLINIDLHIPDDQLDSNSHRENRKDIASFPQLDEVVPSVESITKVTVFLYSLMSMCMHCLISS